MNTLFEYMYRDAANYKTSGGLILMGRFNLEVVKAYLEDGEFFIPSQVGLPDLQPKMMNFPSDADHVWHTIDSVSDIDRAPTLLDTPAGKSRNLFWTADDLLRRFQRAHKEGWKVSEAVRRLGLPCDFV